MRYCESTDAHVLMKHATAAEKRSVINGDVAAEQGPDLLPIPVHAIETPVAHRVALRARQGASAGIAAYLNQGVSGELLRCDKGADYCKVSADHRNGYLARSDFWGAFDDEAVAP